MTLSGPAADALRKERAALVSTIEAIDRLLGDAPAEADAPAHPTAKRARRTPVRKRRSLHALPFPVASIQEARTAPQLQDAVLILLASATRPFTSAEASDAMDGTIWRRTSVGATLSTMFGVGVAGREGSAPNYRYFARGSTLAGGDE